MGYHVLIAEDMASNRKLIKAVIEKELRDITFHEAVDGFQTLKMINEGQMDLVILDIMMPGKDGLEVLKELKSSEEHKDLPVIIYSAMESIESINAALQLGAYDYFTKPLTPQQTKIIVPLKVKNALEMHEQRKALVTLHENIKIELMLAKLFQQNLMTETAAFSDKDMFGRYLPCDELGGDFYDCVQDKGNLWFIMADVSGQGVAAAMISSMLKVEFANCVKNYEFPQEVLQHMNQTFLPLLNGLYDIGAFVGKIKGSEFCYSNAGHPYPLLYKNKGEGIRILDLGGPALGLVDKVHFPFGCVPVASGDMVLAYTKGLFESRAWNEEGREYEELSRYFSEYKELAKDNPQEFINVMLQVYANVQNTRSRDDIAIMLVRNK